VFVRLNGRGPDDGSRPLRFSRGIR
jgi:hypothetical protein